MERGWKRTSLICLVVLVVLGLAEFIIACGGHSSIQNTVPNPTPTVQSISPTFAIAGASSQAVVIIGSGFMSSSTVTFNGVSHATSFINSGQLNLALNASDLATPGDFTIAVANPPPQGGSSTSYTFAVWNSSTDPISQLPIAFPPNWTFSDVAVPSSQPPQIGFAPPAKKIDPSSEYVGDIVETFIPNPSGVNLDSFYANVAPINLFMNSQSYSRLQINGYSAVQFTNVAGMIPTDVVAIDKGQTVVEVSDVGEQHASDGLLAQFAASVR